MTSVEATRVAVSGVSRLSAGTAVIRGVTVATQFLMAVWLGPEQFGYWAAAISVSAFAVALTNFGMVDGYLSLQGLCFRRLLVETTIGNLLLIAPLLVIGFLYFLGGAELVALLILLVALNVPLTGLSEVLSARRLSARKFNVIVLSQGCAAVAKFAVGIALAAWTGSAIAIGLSAICFSLIMIALLARDIKGETLPDNERLGASATGARIKWAANSLAMRLPPYAGLFVAQFLTTAEVLGIYYLSFQAVIAVTAVIAPPLKRVALSVMAQSEAGSRVEIAQKVSHLASSVTATSAALAILLLPVFWHIMPTQWAPALGPLMIFMGQIPARMLSPVVDAYQQAGGAWWKSTIFHLVDIVVTSVAVISILFGGMVALAVALSISRVGLVCVRCFMAYRGQGKVATALVSITALLSIILILAAVWRSDTWILAFTCLVASIVWAGASVRHVGVRFGVARKS